MTGQDRIRERVAKLEDILVDQSDEEPLAVILIGDADDIRLADSVESWLTYNAQLAAAEPNRSGLRRVAIVDPDIEKIARRKLEMAQNGSKIKNQPGD